MENNVIRGIILTYVMSLIIACSPNKEQPATSAAVDKDQIKKDIQAREDEFVSVYNSGEIRNIGYYADDAISYSQNRAPLTGKKAIVDYLISNRDTSINFNKISFTTNEVYVADSGNQVVEIGYYKIVDSTNVTVNSGNYMSIFEKRDGKYVCIRDMSTSDMPVDE